MRLRILQYIRYKSIYEVQSNIARERCVPPALPCTCTVVLSSLVHPAKRHAHMEIDNNTCSV